MISQLNETLDLTSLLFNIGAETYQQDLRELSEAGLRGSYWEFKDQVASDLGQLVTESVLAKSISQVQLEGILQGGHPWGFHELEYEPETSERSVMYELVKTGLIAYYDASQTHPNFHERKTARQEHPESNKINSVTVSNDIHGPNTRLSDRIADSLHKFLKHIH